MKTTAMKSISLSIVFVLVNSNVMPLIMENNELDKYIQGVDNVDNLWYSKPAHDAVFDKSFVCSLNNFITLEKDKVVFSNEDEDLLTKECNIEDESCSVNKAKSIKKINTKLQAIKCVNSVIVESLFVIFNFILLMKLETKDLNKAFLKYQKLVARMLSVMYAGKSYVPQWNLTIYIRLLGYIDIIKNNGAIFPDNSNLKEDVKNYRCKCQQFDYVPSDKNEPNALIESLYNNNELTELYQHAERFKLINLTLSPLYLYDHCLFMKSNWNKINWRETRELLKDAKTSIYKLYFGGKLPRQWMLIPLSRLAYHEAILKIVYVRILHCTWLHLITYQYNVLCGAMEDSLTNYWNLLLDPLHEAVWFAAIDDSFFSSLLHTLKSTVKTKISDKRLSELVRSSRKLLKEYLTLLKVDDVENRLNNVTLLGLDREDVKPNDIRGNTEDLSYFIDALKEVFRGIDTDSIFLIKFLVRAKTDISFFTPNFVYPCFSVCRN